MVDVLLNAIGPEGSVVAYYSSFEEGRLRELAAQIPECAGKLNNIADRLVDPLPVVRDAVYDEGFEGSFSLKSVGPALLGDAGSYERLEIRDGEFAGLMYKELISNESAPERNAHLRTALLQYCKRDTEITWKLVHWLLQQVQRGNDRD